MECIRVEEKLPLEIERTCTMQFVTFGQTIQTHILQPSNCRYRLVIPCAVISFVDKLVWARAWGGSSWEETSRHSYQQAHQNRQTSGIVCTALFGTLDLGGVCAVVLRLNSTPVPQGVPTNRVFHLYYSSEFHRHARVSRDAEFGDWLSRCFLSHRIAKVGWFDNPSCLP